MQLGFASFVIALVGVALAFSLGEGYTVGNSLANLAFALVVLGVAGGFVAVAWGWLTFFRPKREKTSK